MPGNPLQFISLVGKQLHSLLKLQMLRLHNAQVYSHTVGSYCLPLFFIFQKVAAEVARLHDQFYTNKTLQEMAKVSTLQQLGPKYYLDSDLVDTLPKDLEFNT